jgi:hypothetical protein
MGERVKAECPSCRMSKVRVIGVEEPRFDPETKEWLSLMVVCECGNCTQRFGVGFVPTPPHCGVMDNDYA